jgi:hypothetical protein
MRRPTHPKDANMPEPVLEVTDALDAADAQAIVEDLNGFNDEATGFNDRRPWRWSSAIPKREESWAASSGARRSASSSSTSSICPAICGARRRAADHQFSGAGVLSAQRVAGLRRDSLQSTRNQSNLPDQGLVNARLRLIGIRPIKMLPKILTIKIIVT